MNAQRMGHRPLPLGPLWAQFRPASIGEAAAVFGVEPRSVHRWLAPTGTVRAGRSEMTIAERVAGGSISLDVAERVCARLGLHIVEVWGLEAYVEITGAAEAVA